jgi:hypothetical protein
MHLWTLINCVVYHRYYADVLEYLSKFAEF